MNVRQYELVKINEELGELQQAISKALRFGLDNINPNTKERNRDAIQRETLDVITSLARAGLLPYSAMISCLPNGEIYTREAKYLKWLEYSKTIGIVKDLL